MRVGIHKCVLIGFVGAVFLSIPNPAPAGESPVATTVAMADKTLQEDFPAVCIDRDGSPWVVYVEYDHQADRLKLARKTGKGLEAVGTLAGPGVIHQPSVACDGKGTVWAVWSEFGKDNAWQLKARASSGATIQAETVILDGDSGSAVFSDAATDASGRVWVVWQSFRMALGDIFAKYYDPADGKWSEEIRVTTNAAGDWEPRLAFSKDDGAWIAFDSSRGDVFNVYLANVSLDGKTRIVPLSHSLRHQARPSITATADGKGFWVAWENGKVQWGQNSRGVLAATGLNADKRVDVVYYDVASRKVTSATDPTAVLRRAGAQKKRPPAAPGEPPKKPLPKAATGPAVALNLPGLVVDGTGTPWLTCRYYRGTHWKIALTRYDPQQKNWTEAVTLANSSFGQDRRCNSARDRQGRPWLVWPSDLRTTKRALVSGVYLTRLDPAAKIPVSQLAKAKPASEALPPAKWGDDTPDRPREDRHFWSPAEKSRGEKKYGLYWGDFHRHTDISNCRTPDDGCIVEQFRYAYDVGKLDLLGTSDHTDIGKPYDPYEWWCDQKLADVFFVPNFFTSFYVYEREQKWPWGHRNVIFTQRGAPIIYINRKLYQSMPWNAGLPAADDGGAEILPQELWQLLRKSKFPVSVISHTGATGMGTDWDRYEKIDSAVENLVEIYQGARVSYEGTNTPQPTVGFPRGKTPQADAHGSVKVGRDFGQYNKGVYQNALRNGYKLGVFANSDHISTHTTFGGVYTESFTRQGVLDALNARRTIAATDKIFMEFSCNGHLLGEVFTTKEKPIMKVSVRGTAPLRAVTIIRNEQNIRRFTPEDSADFDGTFTDDEPLDGENRYYVRVEQVDGNMGWTSPVWVTFQP